MAEVRIFDFPYAPVVSSTRGSFNEALALKSSLDNVLGRLNEGSSGPVAFSTAGVESSVLMPASRFINPAGVEGATVPSHRCENIYRVGGIDMQYEAFWPEDRFEARFERLGPHEQSFASELFLYGKVLWQYASIEERAHGVITRVPSTEALEKRLKRVIEDIVQDRTERYDRITGSDPMLN